MQFYIVLYCSVHILLSLAVAMLGFKRHVVMSCDILYSYSWKHSWLKQKKMKANQRGKTREQILTVFCDRPAVAA
jgi:hypothetical protein